MVAESVLSAVIAGTFDSFDASIVTVLTSGRQSSRSVSPEIAIEMLSPGTRSPRSGQLRMLPLIEHRRPGSTTATPLKATVSIFQATPPGSVSVRLTS